MTKSGFWKILSLGALALLALLGFVLLRRPAAAPTAAPAGTVVVIDPGHGGEDGGAVAADGTAESGVNLAVAQRLDAILTFWGRETLLLRDRDVSLHSPDAQTIRQKKVSDLHNRVAAIGALADPRVISIHQNSFPQAQYHGAQVFYANGPLGQPWAKRTQDNLRTCLEPENRRAEKPIAHDVYLMNHIACPAILVECGFLSNPEELARLKDPSYQTALAAVIAGSYLQYTNEEGATPHAPQDETGLLLHPVWE